MNILPVLRLRSSPSGGMTVDNHGPQTYYNVKRCLRTGGAAGPECHERAPLNVVIAAYGTLSDNLSGITPTFTATRVIAGTSLENPIAGSLHGRGEARSGNVLTVLGGLFSGLLERRTVLSLGVGVASLSTTDVTLGSSTIVSEDGRRRHLRPGLHLRGPADHGERSGHVQLERAVSSASMPPPARCACRTRSPGVFPIPRHRTASPSIWSRSGDWAANAFDFTGTAVGGGAVLSAAYPVNTGSSDESAYVGTLLQLNGNAAPFGTAAPPPGSTPPAFNASAIAPGYTTQQELVIEWLSPGTTKPFSSISPTALVADLSNTALSTVHSIYTGPVPIDLKTLPASPLITTVGADQNQLVLSVGGTVLSSGVSVFSTPASAASDYSQLLTTTFAGTHTAVHLVAFGNYNSASNTFVATRIDVGLQN